MTITQPERSTSPFDRIKRTRPDGSEYWSARDLMAAVAYDKWERFYGAIERAVTSAFNQGIDVDLAFSRLREEGTGGRPREDYALSRFAAYLVVMNGDPRKPEIAAAQNYFATRTREAEIARPALTEDEIVHQALAITAKRVEALTATVEHQERRLRLVEPKAKAFDRWLSSNVNYSADRVAKALRAAGVATGRNRLLDHMGTRQKDGGLEWIYRDARGQWVPFQAQVERGRLAVKFGLYEDSKTGERVGTSTVRITPKGAAKLAAIYGVAPETIADELEADSDAA